MNYYVKRENSDFQFPREDQFRIDEYDLREYYDEMLDDCNELLKIGNLEYLPSHVLKEVDPIAYEVGFNDYVDSLELDEE